LNYFFDVGANVGQTFDWHLCPTTQYDGWSVLCFEPSPRHLGSLLEKAAKMSGRYRVTVLPVAFGADPGVQNLYEKVDPKGDSLMAATWMGGEVGNRAALYQVKVAVLRLSDFILRETDPGDSLVVKLDAEGAEYEIANDLLKFPEALKRITQLHIEWHQLSVDRAKEREWEVFLTSSFEVAGVPVKIWPH
jgi:FkbM family methyltransferase